jgi:hypothetical protein
MTGPATQQQDKPHGAGEAIVDIVIRDLKERKKFGTQKYGEPLKAFNGRNPLVDLYQELIDALVYVRQHLEEDRESEIGILQSMLRTAAENAYMKLTLGPDRKQFADKEDWIEAWLNGLIRSDPEKGISP